MTKLLNGNIDETDKITHKITCYLTNVNAFFLHLGGVFFYVWDSDLTFDSSNGRRGKTQITVRYLGSVSAVTRFLHLPATTSSTIITLYSLPVLYPSQNLQ